jgi:hypothetical protein
MALIKETILGSLSVNENNTLGVQMDSVIVEDGKELSRSNHRKVLAPGDDVSGEDAKVQAVAGAVWTDEVVAAYAAAQAANEPAAEAAPAEESE